MTRRLLRASRRHGLALAACTLLGCTGAAGEPPKDFNAVVAAAKPGAVLTAPSGGAPISLVVWKKTASPAITIRGGTYNDIQIAQSSGIHFVGARVDLTVPTRRRAAIFMQSVKDVSFTDSTISGAAVNGASANSSQKVSFVRVTFTNLTNGLRGIDYDGLEVRECIFTDITGDGIGISGSRDVAIVKNRFAWGDRGQVGHPDAIQIWDNDKVATRDILIEGNTIDAHAQGIFVKSELKGGFDNVRILNNEVVSAYVNGIVLTEARDSVIAGNRVRTRPGSRYTAKVGLQGNVRLTMTDNQICQVYERGKNDFAAKRANKSGWKCP